MKNEFDAHRAMCDASRNRRAMCDASRNRRTYYEPVKKARSSWWNVLWAVVTVSLLFWMGIIVLEAI